jgi:hypothetical protein
MEWWSVGVVEEWKWNEDSRGILCLGGHSKMGGHSATPELL